MNIVNKVDIGNVRGIQGEKGERGERGYTPSYDDLKYQKQNDEFVTIITTKEKNLSDYYLDADNNLCNSEGYLYDEDRELTDEKGRPFDESIYGYEYYRLWIDTDGNFTNEKGEILDENGNPQYVKSDMISDIVAYMYEDEEAYNQIVNDIYPEIVKTLINADPTSEEYKAFFDAIEGDIKYYICEDNPRNSIVSVNGVVENTCKYYDEKGILITDTPVPLEKNALYLWKNNDVDDDNSVMHYDIYLCLENGTVPKNLVSSSNFVHNYNVIDNISVKVEPNSSGLEDEKDVILKLYTRGTRGQFYSMGDVDKIIKDNLIDKLGVNSGIAQLNGSGKVPASQLPAYVDDVVEGEMNSTETVFTPTESEYIDSVKQNGKIYVDKNTRKTYRWSGSAYVLISNPITVNDGSTEAYSSSKGTILENKIGSNTLNTTDKTVTGAINELNNNKVNKDGNKVLSDTNFTQEEKTKLNLIEEQANKYIHPSYTDKPNDLYKITVDDKGHISETNPVSSSDLPSHNHNISEINNLQSTLNNIPIVVDTIQDGNNNAVSSNAVYDALQNFTPSSGGSTGDLSNYIQKSNTTGLIKNDGTIDTNIYALSSTVSSLSSRVSDLESELNDLENDLLS